MNIPFFPNITSSLDCLEEARAMLRFSQSWLDAAHDSKPDPQELCGFSLVLDTAGKLILQAEEKLREIEGEENKPVTGKK